MKILKGERLTFTGKGLFDQTAEFEIAYDNMGEPFREGATVRVQDGDKSINVFLEGHELVKLWACLGTMLGMDGKQKASAR